MDQWTNGRTRNAPGCYVTHSFTTIITGFVVTIIIVVVGNIVVIICIAVVIVINLIPVASGAQNLHWGVGVPVGGTF